MTRAFWEHFHHQSDIGVRGVGAAPAEAFEQVALAMTAVITAPYRVRAQTEVTMELEAPDLEYLLYQWLNELVFQMTIRHLLFGRFHVEIDGLHLRASAWGEPVDGPVHQPAVEIKAATLTALEVRPSVGGLWLAQCVVDV